MRGKTVFVDIDTQVDFMLPHGELYVPQAEQIIPNLRRLMGWAQNHAHLVLSSADAHPPDDPSFQEWPPHCVVGTPGQKRIPETELPSSWIIPNRPNYYSRLPSPLPGQIVLEKVEYDIASNPNFAALLNDLGSRDYLLFGVATDFCVVAAGLALRRRARRVRLVTDAIQAITAEGRARAFQQMMQAGVTLTTTDEILERR